LERRAPARRVPTSQVRAGREPGAPDAREISRLVPALLSWFASNARELPWRRTLDPYAIWVSEIMLQQTQVKTVIPYWERWMRELPDVRSLAKSPSGKLLKLWEGLGYYTRVRNLQKAAHQIVREQGGRFPTNFDDLLALPGVGRYTAGAIASIAFNQPAPILDGNVIRVLTRLFGIAENPLEKETSARLWRLAEALVHGAAASSGQFSILNSQFSIAGPCSALNQSLMELGALVCTPRQPRCEQCPVRRECRARKSDRVDEIPNLGKRAPATARRFVAFLAQSHGRWLVQQRPTGTLNAQLWEFPNVEVFADTTLAAVATKFLGRGAPTLRPFVTFKHTITRYRISLEACLATVPRSSVHKAARWLSPAALERLPLTSAHRKILQALQRHLAKEKGRT
jgi:A/G-specific adenine glycosylase